MVMVGNRLPMCDSGAMQPRTDHSLPVSLWVAVSGAALSSAAVVVVGVVSMFSGHSTFSGGIGLMLIAYGLVIALGAWLGWRRHALARGLIVAPALLNLATCISLLSAGDLAQSVGAAIGACLFAATVVAVLLPASRAALGHR